MTKETSAVDQAAIDTARAEGHATGMKAGAEAERTRISTILDSEQAKSRPAAARMLAFDTDKDSASVAASLGKLPAEVSASTEAPKITAATQFQAAVEEGAPKISGTEAAPLSRAARALAMASLTK